MVCSHALSHVKPCSRSISMGAEDGKGAPKVTSFASQEDIDLVKENLLKATPWQDFLVTLPPYEGIGLINVLFSVYVVELSEEVMKCIERNISENKSLVSEGFLKLTNVNDLVSGETLTAWATGGILSEYFF